MDSHGRRFYGVDDRTYEREMGKYFSEGQVSERTSQRESQRGGNKKTVAISLSGTVSSVVKVISTMFLLFTIFTLVRSIMEEMSSAHSSESGEGDVFDKMFGSEFSGKFKGARLNEGVYQKRREEKILRDSKLESNTTPPPEIRKLIPNPEQKLIAILRIFCSEQIEEMERKRRLKEVSSCAQSPALFRILYRGYTYRELLSEKISKWDYLSEASEYILESFKA